MNSLMDDFINYNEINPKSQNFLDTEFTLSSPFSENSDSKSMLPAFLPRTIKNFLDPEEELKTNDNIDFSNTESKKPFEISN